MAVRCGRWWGLACLTVFWNGASAAAEQNLATEAAPAAQTVAEAEPRATVAGRELAAWVADLGSEHRVVRLRAVRSLAPFGAAAGEALRSALKADDPAVRYIAAVDLGRLAGDPLRLALEKLTVLRADPQHPAVQMAAAFALCRSGNGEGNLSLLVERLEYPERAMACSAAELLEMLGPLPADAAAALEKAKGQDWDAVEARQFAAAEEVGAEEASAEKTGAEEADADPAERLLFRRSRMDRPKAGKEHPNLLWIVAENLSPDLGCYGDPHAKTPHLDRLAAEGVRFSQAYTPAGTGSVVWSGVITGMYPASIGSHNERSRIVPPPSVRCVSEILRAAGYYCTHRGASDHQFEVPLTAWDHQGEAHADWRERDDPTQPFFAVVNLSDAEGGADALADADATEGDAEAGEGEAEAEEGEAEAEDSEATADSIPPFYAATAEARREWARYRARIARMDGQVGELLAKLAADGLVDNTLVVFWSASGRGLPGRAVWLGESTTRVPMIARWPSTIAAGGVRKDLVSVLDLPPTMLAVAGLRAPGSLSGRGLLGDSPGPEPAYLFFHRDRVERNFDLQRGARDRRWKYVRNYQPSKPYAHHPWLSEAEGKVAENGANAAIDGAAKEGSAKEEAGLKPIEELYDCQKDPWEAENLAARPQYAERLARMRRATEQWQQEVEDRGMIPEAVLMHELRPGGKWQRTAAPSIRRSGEAVLIYCSTDGASIAYRTRSGGEWSPWKLYVDAINLGEAEQLEAKAVRLGFRESKISRN